MSQYTGSPTLARIAIAIAVAVPAPRMKMVRH